MKERPLPIDIKETTPGNPDVKWGLKMTGIFLGMILLSYGVFFIFSRGLLVFLNVEREHEYLGSIFLEDTDEDLFDSNLLSYELPESIRDDIYLIESDEANAFATIGAKVLITTTLLEEVANQEELLFIIGHEMAHRDGQDALRAFLTHAPFSLTMIILGYDSSIPYGKVSNLMIKYIDRNIESAADQGGIDLLHSLELNTKCATGFFESNITPGEKYINFLSTHPISQDRIDKIVAAAGEYGEKPCTGFKK